MIGDLAPGATFEAWAPDGFATGLTGTLGVRIRTAAGASFLARTTTGITEDVAGSSLYRRSFTAPTTLGDYVLLWDDTTLFKHEEFRVLYSSAASVAPTGRDLCSLTDVTALVPGYDAGDDAKTDAVLQEFLTEQSRDAMERCRREIRPIAGANPRTFDITATVWRTGKLFIGDLAAITSVTIKDANGTTIQTVSALSYVAYPRVREDWQPYGWINFRQDVSAPASLVCGYVVEIDGTWGFQSVPTTVKDAVARLTLLRYINDVAAAGTELADALNRADFNMGAWWRQSLDAIDRLCVPTF